MKNNEAAEFYKSNEDFQRYVDRYCNTYRVTKEEALAHRLVQEVMEDYKSGYGGN